MSTGSVISQRIYSWAFETKLSGLMSPAIFPEAAEQFRAGAGPDVRVWLLNAGAVTFDLSMLGSIGEVTDAIAEAVSNLRSFGVKRIVLILPELARPFVGLISVSPITVHPFASRSKALEWLQWLGRIERRGWK